MNTKLWALIWCGTFSHTTWLSAQEVQYPFLGSIFSSAFPLPMTTRKLTKLTRSIMIIIVKILLLLVLLCLYAHFVPASTNTPLREAPPLGAISRSILYTKSFGSGHIVPLLLVVVQDEAKSYNIKIFCTYMPIIILRSSKRFGIPLFCLFKHLFVFSLSLQVWLLLNYLWLYASLVLPWRTSWTA